MSQSQNANDPMGRYPAPSGAPVISGQPPTPRRPRWARVLWWTSIAVICVGVLGLVISGADWLARTWEMNTFISRVEASESAMAAAQERIGAVTLPSDATADQKQAAERELSSVSASGRDAVSNAGDDVAGVTFLPWHRELLAAQGAYSAHNAAWVDFLEHGSMDPATLFRDDPDIESTWQDAEVAVRAAIPSPALPTLADRIEAIFTDEPVAPDGLTA